MSFSTVNHSGTEVVSVPMSQSSRCVVFALTTDVLQVGVKCPPSGHEHILVDWPAYDIRLTDDICPSLGRPNYRAVELQNRST